MGNEQSRLVKLVREDEERPIRELIAKHGAGVLVASYEHTDNNREWPSFGAYLMHVAVKCEAVNCLKVISQHVDINTKNKAYGKTVLHYGAEDGKLNAWRTLVELGADVNARNSDGSTPLHHAASFNQSSIASFLLSRGAEVNSQNRRGVTPMHWACMWGYLDCVMVLHSAGADATSIKTRSGNTAIDLARWWGHTKVVEFLESVSSKPSAITARPVASTANADEPSKRHIPSATASYATASVASPTSNAATTLARSESDIDSRPPPQQVNPWEHERYLKHFSTLRRRLLVDPGDLLAGCYAQQMLTFEQYCHIRDIAPSKQGECILMAISTTAENFSKFLTILRSHENDLYADMLVDLDMILTA